MTLDRTERQREGVQKWINAGCRGTLQWCTGVGKTRAALTAIKGFLTKNPNKKIVVVVPTEHLKIQWMQELNRYHLLSNVTVEIINSAIKTEKQIDFLILDECHRIPSDTFYAVFNQRQPKIVLGLSATFSRLDGRHELLNQFCPVCDIITVKEAIYNKWLAPYIEYKVIIEPEDIAIYREANRQFNESFAVFNFDFNLAMSCMTNIIYRRSYGKKMGMAAKDLDAVVFTWGRSLRARKAYVMDHVKKLEVTRKILAARPNKKAITFSATIKQAELIGNGYVVHSGNTKKKNRITMEEFAQLPIGVIHTAKSLDEGSDVPGLSLAIILSNTSSQTQKTQRLGRVIRYEEGKEAEVFTLVIKGTMEEGWYNNSTAGKSYIEITESELDEILLGKESENIIQEGKEVGQMFRF
jgi:superfamily II DNA or RNA helicase